MAAGQVILRPIQPEQTAVRAVAAHILTLRQTLRQRPVALGIHRPQYPRRGQTAAQALLLAQITGLAVVAGLLLWAAVAHLRLAATAATVRLHPFLAHLQPTQAVVVAQDKAAARAAMVALAVVERGNLLLTARLAR